jgi:methylenetetrahydrofolate reductase (NADPH)
MRESSVIESASATLHRWITSARLEVLPTPSARDLVMQHSPPSRGVTVTASPSKGLEVTLGLSE